MSHQVRVRQQGVGGDAGHVLHKALEGGHACAAPDQQDLADGLPVLGLQLPCVRFPLCSRLASVGLPFFRGISQIQPSLHGDHLSKPSQHGGHL